MSCNRVGLFKRFLKSSSSMILLVVSGISTSVYSQDQSTAEVPGDEWKLEEIVVIGSHFKTKNFASKAPISVLSADSLEKKGVFDIGDIARFEPALSSSFINGSFNAGGSVGAARIRVRNLSTLVLLNGRRQVSTGTASGEVDVNSLVPQIAINRVEILKDGAASLYGSDAVGGVINFTTDKNFTGFDMEGGYSSVTEGNYDDYNIQAKAGKEFGDLNVMAAVSYFNRGQLNGEDRSFTRQAGTIGVGYPMTFFIPAAFGAAPLVEGQCGNVPNTSVKEINPGSLNILPGGLGALPAICDSDVAPIQGLVASSERVQAYAAANLKVNEVTEIYAELAFADVKSNLHTPPSLPFQDSSNPVFIPGTHAQNPFAPISGDADIFAIGFPFLQIGPDRGLRADIDMFRSVVGISHEGSKWSWDASLTYSTSTYERRRPEVSRSAFQQAIISGAFNPFASALTAQPGDAAYNSPETFDLFSVDATLKAKQQIYVADAVIKGELFSIGAGSVEVAFGGQFRRETLDQDVDTFTEAGDLVAIARDNDNYVDRNALAFFTETLVPVTETLNLQFALRYERFSGGTDTLNPKIAASWDLDDAIQLRASYGTSFRSPELVEFGASTSSSARVDDPLTPAVDPVTFSTQIVGSPDLKPESSENYQFGFVASPTQNLNISVDYFSFEFTDKIQRENAQDVLDANPNDPRVLRSEANGAIIGFAPLTFINVGSEIFRGVDVAVNWDITLGENGKLLLSGAAQFVTDYEERETDGTLISSALGYPETSIMLAATWEHEIGALTVSGKHYGGYDETATLSFGSHSELDLLYRLSLNEIVDTSVNAELTFGVRNVTNELPQFHPFENAGYDFTSPFDARGRLAHAKLKISF